MKRLNRFVPTLDKLEIDITYACNLYCLNCCRSCTQAPEQKHMELDMIFDFLKQTEKINRKWKSVHVLGGEPTLHPKFQQIIEILDTWFRKNSPDTELKVISNGYGENVQQQLSQIPSYWLHTKSFKTTNIVEYFEPFNQAPIDDPEWADEDYSKGCWILRSGIGLTPQGYFPCALAGGIERIFCFGYGERTIPESIERMQELLNVYCRYCGHFLQTEYRPRDQRPPLTRQVLSMTWEKAYAEWRKRRNGYSR